MFNPEFLTSETDAISGNDLIKYLQSRARMCCSGWPLRQP